MAEIDTMKIPPEDVLKMLHCETHIGAMNVGFQSKEKYIFKRRNDGFHIINLKYTWHKLMLAARAIAAVAQENPAEICVVTSREYVKRAVLKFCKHIGGAMAITERFPPGSFTNRNHQEFREPRLLIVSDPLADHQAVKEASFCNLPVIAFTDSDSPLQFVDIAIPCNNKGKQSIAMMYWLLAREVLWLQNKIQSREDYTFFVLEREKIMVDLYFYRSAEEMKKEEEELEQQRQQKAEELAAATGEVMMPQQMPMTMEKLQLDMPAITDWAAESWDQPAAVPAQPAAPQPTNMDEAQWGGGNADDGGW